MSERASEPVSSALPGARLSAAVNERGGSRGSAATDTATRRPPADFDVHVARRRAATFGGGEPSVPHAIRAFVHRYGWRAYALPILVVVTIVALATASNKGPAARSQQPAANSQTSSRVALAPPPAAPSTALKSDEPSSGSLDHAIKAGALPAGTSYTKVGKGTFTRIAGTSKVVGTSTDGHGVWRYDIEVENGITGIDVQRFATLVQKTLSDPRSWSGHGVALQRVASGRIDFHVSLTSAMTVRQYCGYTIKVETSCYASAGGAPGLDVNRVVLNDARWVRGSAQYVGDLAAYHVYMINHEDGHALGHRHAHECLPDGLAPVMMQQTFGLKSAATGKLCQANPWPYPPGARGAPGAEQADTSENSPMTRD